jgi:hypothetical protein
MASSEAGTTAVAMDRAQLPDYAGRHLGYSPWREVAEVTEIAGGQQVKVVITFEVEGASKPACVAEQVLRYYG